LARLYIADRLIEMADSTAAEFQEVLYRTLANGCSFLYIQEGNEQARTNALSIWVHPHTQWSLIYDSVHIPPIREHAVDRLTRNVADTGRLLITANGAD
jgi:hypothetical protein